MVTGAGVEQVVEHEVAGFVGRQGRGLGEGGGQGVQPGVCGGCLEAGDGGQTGGWDIGGHTDGGHVMLGRLVRNIVPGIDASLWSLGDILEFDRLEYSWWWGGGVV